MLASSATESGTVTGGGVCARQAAQTIGSSERRFRWQTIRSILVPADARRGPWNAKQGSKPVLLCELRVLGRELPSGRKEFCRRAGWAVPLDRCRCPRRPAGTPARLPACPAIGNLCHHEVWHGADSLWIRFAAAPRNCLATKLATSP